MQSKSTFPARIAPFSVPEPLPFSPIKKEKNRERRDSSGKRGLTLHCCISIKEEVKINDLQKSIVTGLL